MIAPKGNGVLLRPWPTLEVNGRKSEYRGPMTPWSDEWAGELAGAGIPLIGAPGAPGPGSPAGVDSGELQALGGGAGSSGAPAASDNVFVGGPPRPADGIVGLPRGAAVEAGAGQNGLAITSPPAVQQAAPAPRFHRGQNALPSQDYATPSLDQAAPYGMNPFQSAGVFGGPQPIALSPLGPDRVVVAESGVGPRGEPGVWLTVYTMSGGRLERGASTFHAFHAPRAAERLHTPNGYYGRQPDLYRRDTTPTPQYPTSPPQGGSRFRPVPGPNSPSVQPEQPAKPGDIRPETVAPRPAADVPGAPATEPPPAGPGIPGTTPEPAPPAGPDRPGTAPAPSPVKPGEPDTAPVTPRAPDLPGEPGQAPSAPPIPEPEKPAEPGSAPQPAPAAPDKPVR
jgi:hypothetical protein